jgi:hypothetical protein
MLKATYKRAKAMTEARPGPSDMLVHIPSGQGISGSILSKPEEIRSVSQSSTLTIAD